MTLCCKDMQVHLQSGEVQIKYNPKFREYGVLIADGGSSVQAIYFCPWCGKQLPSSLRDKWFEVVCDELGFEPGDENIPDKYNTDAWWLRKGNK